MKEVATFKTWEFEDGRYFPDREAECVMKDCVVMLPADCAYIHQILVPKTDIPIDGRNVYTICEDRIVFTTHNIVTRRKITYPKSVKIIYISVEKYKKIEDEEKDKEFNTNFWYKRKETERLKRLN